VDDSDLIIFDGCTFMYSDGAGDVEVEEAEGSSTGTSATSRAGACSSTASRSSRSRAGGSITTRRGSWAATRTWPCGAIASSANQLPEVFAGFRRDEARMPVEYPGALKPQSWAAAAPLRMIRTVLGLDVVNGKLRSKPCLPRAVGRLWLRGVRVHGTLQGTR
jgi:hypothetical protein